MKKILAMVLVAALTFGMVGCGDKKESKENQTVAEETDGKTALDLIDEIWGSYSEEEAFPVSGGDYENMSFEAPAAFDVTRTDDLAQLLGVPAEAAALLDDGASMVHSMNQNTFTGAVLHVTESDQLSSVAEDIKESILNRQWMCGFPDLFVLYSLGDEYVIFAFGLEEQINTFKTKVADLYETETLLYEESLAF